MSTADTIIPVDDLDHPTHIDDLAPIDEDERYAVVFDHMRRAHDEAGSVSELLHAMSEVFRLTPGAPIWMERIAGRLMGLSLLAGYSEVAQAHLGEERGPEFAADMAQCGHGSAWAVRRHAEDAILRRMTRGWACRDPKALARELGQAWERAR